MDHAGVALVRLVAPQRDALELLQLAEEVLDQVPPLIHLTIDVERLGAARVLSDHDLGPAIVQLRDDLVAVERLVRDQRPERDPLDQRRNAHRLEPLARQQHEADQVAERVGERHDLGRHPALGPADGLARSPPFAPWPWRWTLTMVPSTIAYSRSGSPETASNRRSKTPALTQSRNRLNTLFRCPNSGGRSRQGLPVLAIHSTASTNSRLSPPVRPGSPFFPRQCGSILAHWASVSTNLPIRSPKHDRLRTGSANLNRP